jgi:hypothetical protein
MNQNIYVQRHASPNTKRMPTDPESSRVRGYRLNSVDDVPVIYTPNKDRKEVYRRMSQSSQSSIPDSIVYEEDYRTRRREPPKRQEKNYHYKQRRVGILS